jgi:hypothetical protein
VTRCPRSHSRSVHGKVRVDDHCVRTTMVTPSAVPRLGCRGRRRHSKPRKSPMAGPRRRGARRWRCVGNAAVRGWVSRFACCRPAHGRLTPIAVTSTRWPFPANTAALPTKIRDLAVERRCGYAHRL